MTRDKLFGSLLLTIPPLIAVGFVFRSLKLWIGIDAVIFFITGTIGLLLLLKPKG